MAITSKGYRKTVLSISTLLCTNSILRDDSRMEEEDSTVFTIHNGDVVIRRNRQGGIAINITSFTVCNTTPIEG